MVTLVYPWGIMRICLRNVGLPERLQGKLGEGTAHGNCVNKWLCKVELKANLEQSRLELQHKKQLGRIVFKMVKMNKGTILSQT